MPCGVAWRFSERTVLVLPSLPARGLAVAVGAASSFMPFPVHAQSGSIPVIVTAARSAQSAADALADVTVIGSEEIARAGPGGVAELLQRQPGIEITRNGGPAGVTSLFLRGSNRGHTIVLVDGVRVDSATSGAATLEALPLADIERIEILRGPASGLYGADAIGGVVQVFTRGAQASGFRAAARAGYGTFGTAEYAGSIAGGSAAGNLTLAWAPDQEIVAAALRSRLDAQFDAGPDYDDRTITVVETARVESRNRLHERWTSRLSVAQSVDDSESRTGFGTFPFRTRDRQYTWLHDLALPAGSATVGAERREEQLTSDTAFAVSDRTTNAWLAVYQWHDEANAIAANLRQDRSAQFGTRTNGGATYAYRLRPQLRLSAGFATAFKAPTFNDLYYPGFSNPALKPETSHNVEAAAVWNPEFTLAGARMDVEARATAYYNRVHDLIVFQCDASFVCAPQNVSSATLEGVTLTLAMQRADTTVKASLDVGNPRDEASGHLLPRRAREHGTLALLQSWGKWRVGVEWVASSHRYDDAANAVRLAGYGLVNLTAEWAIEPRWTLLLRGDNVLDRDYRLAAGYATGGATVFAAVRWQQ
jgi:vitamin B12 transporter